VLPVLAQKVSLGYGPALDAVALMDPQLRVLRLQFIVGRANRERFW
jgi:hypothetical protein